MQIGPIVATDFVLSTNSGAEGMNKGWGYSLGARMDIPLGAGTGARWRLTPSIRYLRWMVVRNVDPVSKIITPSDMYQQSLDYLVLGLAAGYRLASDSGKSIWLESGLEFLLPVSASQTRNGGAATSFDNSVKPLLVVLGAGIDFPLLQSWNVGALFSGFYNISANGGSSLFGVRAQGAFVYSL